MKEAVVGRIRGYGLMLVSLVILFVIDIAVAKGEKILIDKEEVAKVHDVEFPVVNENYISKGNIIYFFDDKLIIGNNNKMLIVNYKNGKILKELKDVFYPIIVTKNKLYTIHNNWIQEIDIKHGRLIKYVDLNKIFKGGLIFYYANEGISGNLLNDVRYSDNAFILSGTLFSGNISRRNDYIIVIDEISKKILWSECGGYFISLKSFECTSSVNESSKKSIEYRKLLNLTQADSSDYAFPVNISFIADKYIKTSDSNESNDYYYYVRTGKRVDISDYILKNRSREIDNNFPRECFPNYQGGVTCSLYNRHISYNLSNRNGIIYMKIIGGRR